MKQHLFIIIFIVCGGRLSFAMEPADEEIPGLSCGIPLYFTVIPKESDSNPAQQMPLVSDTFLGDGAMLEVIPSKEEVHYNEYVRLLEKKDMHALQMHLKKNKL